MQAELLKSPRKNRKERFEQDLASQIRAHRLPEPVEQHPFAAELGRKFRADFAWPAKEFRFLLEVQGGIFMRGGGGHSHPMHIVKDIERQQLAALLGWYLVPVTTDQVKNGKAIDTLERLFASRGWTR